MITNANRSGFVRVEPGDDRPGKPQDDRRSGHVSDAPPKDEKQKFGLQRRQKIIEVNGERRLADD
jgi:hypothetical protein